MNKQSDSPRPDGSGDSPFPPSVFDLSRAAFELAVREHPSMVHEHCGTLLGRPVRWRIVGQHFARRVVAPLSNTLRFDDATPDLEIELWDVAATGVRPPVEVAEGTLVRSWTVGLETLTVSADGQLVGHQLHTTILWLNRAARRIVGWTAAAAGLSLHQRGKPLQTILSIWGHGCGVQAVHAGLVARDHRAVLFPGKSGSGKSTATLACASAGYAFLSDDWVGVEIGDDPPFVAHGLYGSAWLDPMHARRFPALAVHAVPTGSAVETKSLLLMSDAPEIHVASAAPLAALALPRIVDRAAAPPVRATRAEALLVLAPSTVLQLLPRGGRRELERLARLAEQVPAYWLELGHDLGAIPGHVEEILAATP
ncbi:MAG: hypothetical protein HY270_21070 [Deltaproteobacteria bacterium]|nr:hypothetical protein [Deltaproteobacteria bacterium]